MESHCNEYIFFVCETAQPYSGFLQNQEKYENNLPQFETLCASCPDRLTATMLFFVHVMPCQWSGLNSRKQGNFQLLKLPC